MKLSERLQKIADLVERGARIADIGTDHAYIPAYLAQNGLIERAIASDVIEGPLMRARETVRRTRTGNIVEVRLGDGLKSIRAGEADTLIIAGMGGILISEILNQSPDIVNSAKTIILQPMTGIYELRSYLDGKFDIREEHIAKEGEKLYLILSVKPAKPYPPVSEEYLYIGKYLFENRPEHFGEYFGKTLERLGKKLDGLKRSQKDGAKNEIEELDKLIKKLYKLYNGGLKNA